MAAPNVCDCTPEASTCTSPEWHSWIFDVGLAMWAAATIAEDAAARGWYHRWCYASRGERREIGISAVAECASITAEIHLVGRARAARRQGGE